MYVGSKHYIKKILYYKVDVIVHIEPDKVVGDMGHHGCLAHSPSKVHRKYQIKNDIANGGGSVNNLGMRNIKLYMNKII